jgi:hypothetical protein
VYDMVDDFQDSSRRITSTDAMVGREQREE